MSQVISIKGCLPEQLGTQEKCNAVTVLFTEVISHTKSNGWHKFRISFCRIFYNLTVWQNFINIAAMRKLMQVAETEKMIYEDSGFKRCPLTPLRANKKGGVIAV